MQNFQGYTKALRKRTPRKKIYNHEYQKHQKQLNCKKTKEDVKYQETASTGSMTSSCTPDSSMQNIYLKYFTTAVQKVLNLQYKQEKKNF
jgi:hypothetical protein